MSDPQNRPDRPAPQFLIADEIIPNPYPDRMTRLGGVCQHSRPAATPHRTLVPIRRRRPRHPFGASLLITIAAQGILAASISAQALSPVMGFALAVALMICGLLLILAELVTAANR